MKEEDIDWEKHGLMSDEELKKIDDNFRNTEEEGLKNIVKYFDRIHDKLFNFNNILIAGYYFLAQFNESTSFYTVLIPLFNLAFIIYIEYRMMEKSRVQSQISELPLEEIQKNNRSLSRTNLYSLAVIITTLAVTVILLLNLFSVNSKTENHSIPPKQEVSPSSNSFDERSNATSIEKQSGFEQIGSYKYLIIFLTTVIAIIGVSSKTSKGNGRPNFYGWILILLIISLGCVSYLNALTGDKKNKSKEYQAFTNEQKRHSQLIEQLIDNSNPIKNLRLYYTFRLDSSNAELKRFVSDYLERFLPDRTSFENLSFNIPITKLEWIRKTDYPFIYELGKGSFLSTSIIYQDTISLNIQSGYATPYDGFDIEILVKNRREFTLRYSDLLGRVSSSDLLFTSFNQFVNSTIQVSPIIEQGSRNDLYAILQNLNSVNISNNLDHKVESKNIKGIYRNGFLIYEGKLTERKRKQNK